MYPQSPPVHGPVRDCSVDFVKKRTDLLRENFRRVVKKVKALTKSGGEAGTVCTPKLWYYQLLLLVFLTDQEEVKTSTSTWAPRL